jgi:hypothetical protein
MATADHFEKLLEATCPNHTYPIRHKLKECTMMKNYMSKGTFARGKKPKGDSMGKAAAPFPEEKAVMSIYGGPAPMSPHTSSNLTAGQSKLQAWRSPCMCAGLSPRSLLPNGPPG